MNEEYGEGSASMEMPQYRCHKKVWALKIGGIGPADSAGACLLFPEDSRYAAIKVDSVYRAKHVPTSGGYYVVYDDGYKSFSPAKAFEEGYTLIV
jgi:hypothetical protein